VSIVRLLVATTNRDKLREIRALLVDEATDLLTLRDLPHIDQPDETGTTFAENALLKARHYAKASGLITVAEDSGLVIDALDGEPGVYSARFIRPDATYPERFAVILRRLAEHPERGRAARFMCAVAVVNGDRTLFETVGTIEGEIAEAPRGDRGFGYDPIFYYPPYRTTLADVDEEAKLAVAHRGVAFRALAEWLRTGVGVRS